MHRAQDKKKGKYARKADLDLASAKACMNTGPSKENSLVKEYLQLLEKSKFLSGYFKEKADKKIEEYSKKILLIEILSTKSSKIFLNFQ